MDKKTAKKISLLIGIALLMASGLVYYLFNMPKRNVQESPTDYTVQAKALVEEYLSDAQAANAKYLAADGVSKIIAVSGTIASITEDLKNQKVILLKDAAENAGVSCSFMPETNANTEGLKVGDQVTIKGVIRSGASFDEDMEIYEHVILEKCDLLN